MNFRLLFLPLCCLLLAGAAGHFFIEKGVRSVLLSERENHILDKLAPFRDLVKESGGVHPESLLVRGEFSGLNTLGLKRVTVLDRKGRVLSCTDEGYENGVDPDETTLEKLKKQSAGFFSEEKGRFHYRVYFLPVLSSGGVKFLFSISDLDDVLSLLRLQLIIVLFLLSGLTVLFLLLPLLRKMSLIQALLRGFSFISSGNYRFELTARRAAPVLERFNEMVGTLKKREEQRGQLIEKLKSVGGSGNFTDLFNRILDTVRIDLGAEQIMIMVVRDDLLQVTACRGFDERVVFKEETYPASEDVFAEVTDYGKPILLNDAKEIRRNARYASLVAVSGPVALFPITQGNEIYGIIHAGKGRGQSPFSSGEIETGEAIACGAAVAMTHLGEEGRTMAAPEKSVPTPEASIFSLSPLPSISVQGCITAPASFQVLSFARRKEDCITLLFVQGTALSDNWAAGLLRGMEHLADKLRHRITNLTYFALSVLNKMPDSPLKEKYEEKFKSNPLSYDEICENAESLLLKEKKALGLETLLLDVKKGYCESRFNRLSGFLQHEDGSFLPLTGRLPFRPGDLLLVAEKHFWDTPRFSGLNRGEESTVILKKLADSGAPTSSLLSVIRWN
ncbi:MAG: hypothetical protein A2293_10730 [Elusimicrobia bacterium RIFOXYB2_FULL_49_7]|nr:MAG: hypothetical protein A2293_10730 [Elusimicrobia bacterium RIFOXYB2_FULL_49_7]